MNSNNHTLNDNADAKTLADDFQLLKELSEIAACSGYEEPITHYIHELLKDVCDELHYDSIGNLYATIKGTINDFNILLDAHTDEIGFQVSYIEPEGFIRIVNVGGQNPRTLPGARVIIHSSIHGSILGVIGEKPIHHLSAEERKKTSDISQLYVDIGLSSKEEVEKMIEIGDFITFDQKTVQFAESMRATGKSFDDRAGCWVLIRVLQSLKKYGSIAPTVTAVFTSQEEIGVRGATVAGYHINPNLVIVSEVNHALDYPGAIKAQYGDLKLGKGPIIPIGPNIYPKFSKTIVQIAKTANISIQTTALPTPGSNNARVYQTSRNGIPTGLVKIPLRYMHSAIEVIDLNDLTKCAQLIFAFLTSDPVLSFRS